MKWHNKGRTAQISYKNNRDPWYLALSLALRTWDQEEVTNRPEMQELYSSITVVFWTRFYTASAEASFNLILWWDVKMMKTTAWMEAGCILNAQRISGIWLENRLSSMSKYIIAKIVEKCQVALKTLNLQMRSRSRTQEMTRIKIYKSKGSMRTQQ